MSGGASPARPLRILHVVESFGGGVFEIVKTLAESLATDGDEVAIAYGRRPETPAGPRSRIAAAVELQAIPWAQRGIREQIVAARELRRFAARWKPDVIHFHSSFAGIVGSLALGRSTPSIYTPHGYSFTMRDQSPVRRRAFKAVERITARQVDLIGAVSEAEARSAAEVAPAEKVVLVRNGIPELDDPIVPVAKPGGRPRVVAVGRIDEARQPASASRILAGVAALAEVSWVGGGGRGGVEESVVTDRGIPVTGWLDRAAVLARLRAATACLHWTAWDGQPLSVLEAMANDVVVVASDIEATREILGPRQVCGSEAEATELLREILRNPDLRESLLASQRERSQKFGARRMASEWRTVYERIARTEPETTPGAARGDAIEPTAMTENRPDPS